MVLWKKLAKYDIDDPFSILVNPGSAPLFYYKNFYQNIWVLKQSDRSK